MANTTSAFGLTPVRHLDGSPWNGATIKCYISASYATALFVGDPVVLSPTLAEKDPTGMHPTINLSAGTDGILVRGVIVSIEPDPDNLDKIYSPISTVGYANVCMDPTVIYEVRGDGGGTPSAVFVSQNAVLIATSSGSTLTGISGMNLDEGTTTAPNTTQSFPLHILNIKNSADNTLADDAVYEVLLNTCENATGKYLGITAA